MDWSLYEWVYIIVGVLEIYTMYKLLRVFFDTPRTSWKVELAAYSAFYMVNTFVYLYIRIPFVIIVCSLLGILCMTLNYEGNWRKRVLSALMAYLILVCIETMAAVLVGRLSWDLFAYLDLVSVYGLIAAKLGGYVAALILNHLKNIRRGSYIPFSSWLPLFLVPASSLYILFLLQQVSGLKMEQLLVGSVLIFIVNFYTLYLYDKVTASQVLKISQSAILEIGEETERGEL